MNLNEKITLICIDNDNNEINILAATKIQSLVRGILLRLKRLPLILYIIQKFCKNHQIKFIKQSNGRTNSQLDEKVITELLITKFKNKIQIATSEHMWYDIIVYDNICGWIPVNIKTTTTKTPDNTGNLAMCVYAYTDIDLDLYTSYTNGKLAPLLIEYLQKKKYNKKSKKDYYFLVFNKENSMEIIINSVKGLTALSGNINNLPFQVKWCNNKKFTYDIIDNKVKMFIKCLKNLKPSWSETFMNNIRNVEL